MPEWYDNAKKKVVKGYGNARDSKAFDIAVRTTVGAGGGALNEFTSVRGVVGVVTSGGGTLATGAVKGGLNANGIENSGVDTALNLANGNVDPRTALELTTRAGGKLVTTYRKTKSSDGQAFPNSAAASTTGELKTRIKDGERQIKLKDANGTYGTAVRLEQGRSDHQIHDTLVVNDRERADKDHRSYTNHRRHQELRGGFDRNSRKTNEAFIPNAYTHFNPLKDVLNVRVWFALSQAKDNPGVWLGVPADWSADDTDQVQRMCKVTMGAGNNPYALKFSVAINNFIAAVDTQNDVVFLKIRGGIFAMYSGSNKPYYGYDGFHWAPYGKLSDGSPHALANLPCRPLIEPYADGAGFRWVKGGTLYKLSELHLHGPNGESDWMLTTAEVDEL